MQIKLTKEEGHKLAVLKVIWNKNNKKDVVKKLIADKKVTYNK